MIVTNEKMTKLLKVYFGFVLLELFLLGSGQILKYHSLTLRMVNFILLTIFCLIIFRKIKVKTEYMMMLYVFLALLTFSSVIGYFNGASLSDIFTDVKPQLFFIYLIPFSFLIKSTTDVERVIRIIKISAIIMAILYILYIIIYLFFPFVMLLVLPMELVGDIFFRGSYHFFFYKGFFFVMISVFLISYKSISDRIILVTLLISILFTLTRGFYLAVVAPFFILGAIHVLSTGKIKLNYLIILVLILVIIGISLPYLLNFVGDKSLSDSVRMGSVLKVNEAITPLSMIIGHGFGVTTGINRVHIEVSYFEILHKQGIIGLLVWFFPLVYCFKKWMNNETNALDKRFFLSVVSVYTLSLTNPFITNPLGLSIIVLSIISMDVLYKENQLSIAKDENTIGV